MFLGQTSLGRGIFCTVMIYFFHDSCSFSYTKKLLKVSDHFVEKIQHDSTTLIGGQITFVQSSHVDKVCASVVVSLWELF